MSHVSGYPTWIQEIKHIFLSGHSLWPSLITNNITPSHPGQAVPQLSPSHMSSMRPLPFLFHGSLGPLPLFPKLSHPHTCTRPFILSGLAQTSHPIFQCFPLPVTVTSLILSSPPKILLERQALEKRTFLPKSAVPPWGSLSHLPNPLLVSPTRCQSHPAPRVHLPHRPCPWAGHSPVGLGGRGPHAFSSHRAPAAAEQRGRMRNQKGGSAPQPAQQLCNTHTALSELQVWGHSLPTDSKCMLSRSFCPDSHRSLPERRNRQERLGSGDRKR